MVIKAGLVPDTSDVRGEPRRDHGDHL